jgi:hypothetical protein
MRTFNVTDFHLLLKLLDLFLFRYIVDEVTGDWRKQHNEELHNLYSSSNIIRVIKSRRIGWAGHVARMGEKPNACRISVGKPEGKRPLGRERRRWVYNIEIYLTDIEWSSMGWNDLAQDRDQWGALVNTVRNLGFPMKYSEVLSGCVTSGFSRRA